MSVSRIASVVVAGVIFIAAAAWAVQSGIMPGRENDDTSRTATGTMVHVAERAFSQRIVRQCHIEYGAPRLLSAPADGLLELLVEDGAMVGHGDLIARYEIDKLESEERSLSADIESLRARLAFKTGPYREETESIWQLEREEQDRTHLRLQEKLDEMTTMEAEGQIAPQRLEETRLRLEDVAAERARLGHQRSLDRAQIALDIDQMTHDLEVAEARLDDIAREKERSAVKAPEDGMVVWRDPQLAENGSGIARRGMALASLVKPGRYGAVLTFGDNDMRVIDDASASVSFGEGQAPVEAQIVSRRLVDDPIEQKRGRYDYEVAIAFNGDDGVLHSRALCIFVKPLAGLKPAIPAGAVRFQSGRAYAMKRVDGRTGLVELELGEVADGYVRILSGLKSGDVVVE